MIGSLWIRLRRGIERLVSGQSLQWRLALLTGLSVALSVIVVGGATFTVARWSLVDQLDNELISVAQDASDAIAANLPGATWQRCRTHYAANLMSVTPKALWPAVKAMLHSVYDQPDTDAVNDQFDRIVDALAGFGLESQAAPGDDDLAGTVLGEYDVVVEHAKNFHGIPSGRSAVAPIGS